MSGYLYCSKLVPVLHFDLIEKDEEGLSIHITCGMDMAERARYPMAELHLLKELYEEQTAEGLGVTQPSTQTLTGEGLGAMQPSTQGLEAGDEPVHTPAPAIERPVTTRSITTRRGRKITISD